MRLHVKEQPEAFERFGAQWTPTIIVMDPAGREQHRIEGFLPKEEFVAQLQLGRAHALRATGEFAGAEKIYRKLAGDESNEDVAAESLYWAGVSKYKGGDQKALGETAAAFKERFTKSSWAKKSSVWG